MPVLLHLYRLLTYALAPFIRMHVRARARALKEDPARLNERWGITETPAFPTPPCWIHAASVGEAAAALTLIPLIRQTHPDLPLLLTTGTVTSAHVVSARLPPNTVHQYAPYDHPAWIARFLDHWRPCAALRLESELWPNTLLELKQRSLPTALINARLSVRSFSRWRRFPRSIQTLLSTFTLVLADGETVAGRLRELGARAVVTLASIKFLATPPATDPAKLAALGSLIGARPAWLYASTHADEELIAAQIHAVLKRDIPDLLTVISPRHPNRRDDIARALAATTLSIAWRGRRDPVTPATDLYIADTMGELMDFYAHIPLAVIGRSFSIDGGGGHNPIEAAMMGCYPLSGPHVQNLDTIFEMMHAGNAVEILPDVPALTARLADLFFMTDLLNSKRSEARHFIAYTRAKTENALHTHLDPFLNGSRS